MSLKSTRTPASRAATIAKKAMQLNKQVNSVATNKLLRQMLVFGMSISGNSNSRSIQKFFKKHNVGIVSSGGYLTSSGVMGVGDLMLAKKEGIYFLYVRKPGDTLSHTTTDIYVLRWQRHKAEEILVRWLKDSKPLCTVETIGGRNFSESKLNLKLGKRRQFVRQEDYDKIDKLFDRMVNDKEWYTRNNKTFKEVVFLHGPPGTGKTSLVSHFSTKYLLDVVKGSPADIIKRVKTFKSDKPLVVLMEEIDACTIMTIEGMGDTVKTDDGDFTYSNIVEWLDGLTEVTNVIIVMTTNHKEKIIKSIYRPGRVTLNLEMVPLTPPEIANLVGGKLESFIAGLKQENLYISNIPDLKLCETEEDVLEVISHN